MQVAVLVNAALGLAPFCPATMAGVSILIDIDIFRKISIDIDRNIRIPHRNSTIFFGVVSTLFQATYYFLKFFVKLVAEGMLKVV